MPGVANVGTRPTVNGQECRLEVHLFDFDQDIYGRHLEVEFVLKLRDERCFDSFDELRRQIALDAAAAREYLRVPAMSMAG
jgi:riboflavin kinase/FMN adenylyltransferase